MRITPFFVFMACATVSANLIAGEPGKLREISTKGIKINFEKGKVSAPKTFSTAEELAKAIPNSDSITKQVDFGREKLVLFAWGGSGGDKLTAKAGADGKQITFQFTQGLTFDYRPHIYLFAVPKMAELKISGAPPG